ncbi:ABC transporter ATP-binding protein [Glaciecola siphonariae]|uniref:ABC transporter ATP-binding protein n=1 Tax=Glaciecola siphonariae TaxID=521012 RepID=A0ABV9LXI3_9ALTE
MLEIKALTKSYQAPESRIQVLERVDLSLAAGQSLSIQGPSGCGKSTLLHLIGALDKPDSGTIALKSGTSSRTSTTHTNAGESFNVHELSETHADAYRRQHVGFVFQKFNLIDCLSVQDNIFLPSKLNGYNDNDYIMALIDALDIAKHVNKLPNQLSGGEQQRVAIARALAHKPRLVLADEPTGNLDEVNSDKVCQLLYQTCQQANAALVLVTHSSAVAKLADSQAHMQNKQLVRVS